eukprot:1638679-Pleurochrysis_carterae.AAC.1
MHSRTVIHPSNYNPQARRQSAASGADGPSTRRLLGASGGALGGADGGANGIMFRGDSEMENGGAIGGGTGGATGGFGSTNPCGSKGDAGCPSGAGYCCGLRAYPGAFEAAVGGNGEIMQGEALKNLGGGGQDGDDGRGE